MDYVSYSLFFAFITCIATQFLLSKADVIQLLPSFSNSEYEAISWLNIFVSMIEFKPLMFILGMQIIVVVSERYKIFQWVAVQSIHITKGNHRLFFYLVCIISTIFASIIADVTVAVLFVPLIIRACRILKIKAAPFLYGISVTINIGSLLTPFSSSKNILIASQFNLSFLWFVRNMGGFIIFTCIITLILLDLLILRKIKPPTEERRQIFLDIMDPKLIIPNRFKFLFNSTLFILIIVSFLILPEYSPFLALFGGVIMIILNRLSFVEILREIDMKVIFFFIALFLIVGCMEVNETFSLISDGLSIFNLDNIYVMAIGVLIFSSLFSGFLASNPTAVLLIKILVNLYPADVPDIVLIALLLGLNLGGNLLPQGATCDLMTLNLAKKHKVENFTYKSLFKIGGTFALIHIGLCFLYLTVYYLVLL